MSASSDAAPATRTDTLTLHLRTPVADERPVYVVGNFNNWEVADPRYRLQPAADGYRIDLPTGELEFPFEYKYTKGDWSHVELDRYGNTTNNRRQAYPHAEVHDYVPRWELNGLSYNPALLPKIEVLTIEGHIPDNIKTRRIAALLPHDYYESDKRYPVLYLQDGQNLFDEHAPFGNWAVDKKLAVLQEQGLGDLIVIAIDHAKEKRAKEFTPSYNTTLGVGEGRRYVRFLADRLKPYVDGQYRTLSDRTHTGIGGSSMGGLVSIYAGLMYPELYSKLLIFSPALWVAPNIARYAMGAYEWGGTQIYLYAGAAESKNMVPNVQRFKAALEGAGLHEFDFKLSIDPHGTHNEEAWGREFGKAIRWLFPGA